MKRLRRTPFLFAIPLFSLFTPRVRARGFFIHDSDPVVFLGDRITQQRLYTTYIEGGAELAKGCNLALPPGPITDQAQAILKLVFKRNDVYFHRSCDVEPGMVVEK